MTDWASSGGIKVKRAKKHVRGLEAEIGTFLKRHPYRVVSKVDEEARRTNYYLSVVEMPPPELGAIAGDALHDLRSALDALWRRVWHGSHIPVSQRSREFPVFENADSLESAYPLAKFEHKRRLKSAVDILYALKPYKGGNDLLWMLSEGNAADKHRILLPAYACVTQTFFEMHGMGKALGLVVPPIRLGFKQVGDSFDAIEDGAYLHWSPLDEPPGVDVKAEHTIQIAFGEPEALKGRPMVDTLNQIGGVVDGVVESFRIAALIA